METCDNQSVIAFDRLYTTNHIQILKVLLPFVDPSAQKNMIILIKFLELQYTLSYIGQSGALGAASRQTHPGGSAPFDIVQIFEQIRNFCTPTEQAKPILAEQGWDLEVTVFDDYVQPNKVVESGQFDANYFQHIPYLESFNEEQGTHLVNAGGIHYEPFGIYPGTKSDLSTLESGDVIAVPNDTTNEARALLLLQDNGILTLADGVGLEATVRDIVDNPYGIEIQELEAAQVPRVKDEVAFAVMNGNYAMEAGFSVSKDAVAYEKSDSEAAQTYVNVIAVKEGNENNEGIKALVDVLKSDAIVDYINNTYDGGVIPFE